MKENVFSKIKSVLSVLLCAVVLTSTVPNVAYGYTQKDLCCCQLEQTSFEYTGKIVKPKLIAIRKDLATLKANKDYKLVYTKRKAVGAYTVKINFKGSYKNIKSKTFKYEIRPRTPDKPQIVFEDDVPVVTWKLSSSVSGYQLQVSQNKLFDYGSIVYDGDNEHNAVRFTDGRNGVTYYIRIRATFETAEKTVYSDWSDYVSFRLVKTSKPTNSSLKKYTKLVKTINTKSTLVENKLRNDSDGQYVIKKNGIWQRVDYYICYNGEIMQRLPNVPSYSWDNQGNCYMNEEYSESLKEYWKLLYKFYKKAGITSKMSDIEKYLRICKTIRERITYNHKHDSDMKITAYDGLKYGKTVCGGFSVLVYDMCFLAGVPCEYMVSEEHAWNLIKFNGRWYYDEFAQMHLRVLNSINNKKFKPSNVLQTAFFSPYNSGGYKFINKMSDNSRLKLKGKKLGNKKSAKKLYKKIKNLTLKIQKEKANEENS